MMMQAAYDVLSRRQMRAVLSVLERCEELDEGPEFREGLADAVSSAFGIANMTFFHGPTYSSIFDDPAPLLTGSTAKLLPDYQEWWRDKDVFALPEARGALTDRGFATLDELSRLPRPQHSYVVDYLRPHGIATASAIHLTLADGEALLGMFDQADVWDETDLVAVRLLARQLRARTATVSVSRSATDELAGLTPRQREVAALVSEGCTNSEIADRLFLSELSIKKYISRIFDVTGFRNRSELAAAWLRSERAGRSRAGHPAGS
ncbi:helix-turn-helix domain-containing protein [Gordonia sp. (in: high G+C Gram-positive bacteria)]|uniref:helix-turn-helix transcriptional regulator n=1 Tax=Gordonia sp. (in: high G+C Gram-positive bacteria) TaxID=84139 RepID=UPI003F9B52C7